MTNHLLNDNGWPSKRSTTYIYLFIVIPCTVALLASFNVIALTGFLRTKILGGLNESSGGRGSGTKFFRSFSLLPS